MLCISITNKMKLISVRSYWRTKIFSIWFLMQSRTPWPRPCKLVQFRPEFLQKFCPVYETNLDSEGPLLLVQAGSVTSVRFNNFVSSLNVLDKTNHHSVHISFCPLLEKENRCTDSTRNVFYLVGKASRKGAFHVDLINNPDLWCRWMS
jgi:hypothetical protein